LKKFHFLGLNTRIQLCRLFLYLDMASTRHPTKRVVEVPTKSLYLRKGSSNAGVSARFSERETDENRLNQRQKQIDIGKNTIAYQKYISEIARSLLNCLECVFLS
jgi:hypothetical protein